MSSVEGIGEAVTGGMAARAVEPQAGETDATVGAEACLNCDAPLAGPFCHQCGQRGHVHRTVSAWWHDFLHSVLHLDGKFWRTLPMLAWRPGELTRRYVNGERARFISPLALFLFSVFLMFAVFSVSGVSMFGNEAGEAARDVNAEISAERGRIDRLEAERAAAVAAGRDPAPIDARIAAARADIAEAEQAIGTIEDGGWERTGWERLDKGIEKAGKNPALLFYKLQTNAYKFSWALIPISLPFLWVLFLHRRRYRRAFTAYDHLVFVTYSIAFMSLAFIALVVLRSPGVLTGLFSALFLFVPPIHIYRQLRGAYGLGRLSAAWRTLALLVFATIALTLFFLLLLTLGLLG